MPVLAMERARHLSALMTSLALLALLLGLAGCGPGGEEGAGASGDREAAAASSQPDAAPSGLRRVPIPQGTGPFPIAAGELHHRDFHLAAGDFLQLEVQQQGIDLAVQLEDPEGQRLIRVDSPNGKNGPEELVEIAATPGRYRFQVVAPAGKAAPGRYTVQVLARRPATTADRELVAADHAHHAGRGLWKEGRSQEAIRVLRKVLASWVRLDLPGRRAQTLDALHRAYLAVGEPEIAAVLCEQAAELFQQVGDPLQTAVMLQSGGWTRLRLGQPERAIEPLRQAIALYEPLEGYGWAVARSLGNLGTAYHELGQLQRALTYFDQALDKARVLKKRSLGDELTEALLLCDRGPVLLGLNRPQEALDGYSRALEVFRRESQPVNVGIALTGVAQAALQVREHERAEDSIVEALPLLREPANAPDRLRALKALAQLRYQRGDVSGARAAFVQAQEVAQQVKDRRGEALLLLDLGRLEVTDGDPRRGLELLSQALNLCTEMDDLLGQTSAQVRSAQALAALGHLSEAWQRLGPALSNVEALRTSTDRRDFRTSYFAFRQEYFEIAIDVLMRLHGQELDSGYDRQAFVLNERRLARELVDSLERGDRFEGEEIDPVWAARERALEAQLAQAASRAPGETSEAQNAEGIARLLADLQQVRAEIRREQVRGQAPLPEPRSVEEISSSLLDADSLLLVYALGERRSYLWALSPEGLTLHTLPPRQEIESLARTFSENVVGRVSHRREVARSVGARLSEILLGPVASRLGDRRLLLVTEGALQAVPFAALPEPSGSFLIQRHEIVVLPSATTLVALRRTEDERRQGQRPIAAFADPVFDPADPRVGRRGGADTGAAVDPGTAGFPASGSRFKPSSGDAGSEDLLLRGEINRSAGRLGVAPFVRLPSTREEAEGILALAPPGEHLLVVDFAASRDTLAGTDLERYGILHFATHALAHPEHPELSGLVLSMVDQEGRPQNGFFRAYEISRLRLPADLVVLSACETGLGKDLRGEGMLSLTRSFFDAGAGRVIATLWQVSDRRSARLMTQFYEGYLRRDLSPAAALRQAQLSLLEDPATAAPYYWAGFSFQGDWRRPR